MFFRLLKLAGLDVNAKIAELKADLAHSASVTTFYETALTAGWANFRKRFMRVA